MARVELLVDHGGAVMPRAEGKYLSTWMEPRTEDMIGSKVPIFTPWPSKINETLNVSPPEKPQSAWSRAMAEPE